MPEPKSAWKRLPFDFDGDPGPAPPSTLPEELARASSPEAQRVQRHIDQRCEYFTRLLFGERFSGEALRLVSLIISDEVGASVVVQITPPFDQEGQRLIGYELHEPAIRRVQGAEFTQGGVPAATLPVMVDGQIIGEHVLNPDGTNPWAEAPGAQAAQRLRRVAAVVAEAQRRSPNATPPELERLAYEISANLCQACTGTGQFAMPGRIAGPRGSQDCFRCNGLGLDLAVGR